MNAALIAPSTPELSHRLIAPDGTSIAYGVDGHSRARATGTPLVLSNGLTTTTTFWRYLQPRWARAHRVLSWDLPGHGASGAARSAASADLAEQPEILVRLMDAAEMPRAIQIGWSTGCQVVLEMYRRYPERCSALVLLLGSAGRVLSTAKLPLPGAAIERIVRHTPRPVFSALTRTLARIAHGPGGQFLPRRLDLIGVGTSRQDAALITEHLTRIDPFTVQAMIASAQQHSAWDVLERIRVPLLIIAGDRDPFAPADVVGVQMHARCPQAQLLRLPEGTHTALLDHAETIGQAVDDFLRAYAQYP